MDETRVQVAPQVIPFAWAVQTAGHHCRLGFEPHEFDLPFDSPALLSQVAKYFRLSLGPQLPTDAEVTVTPELPEYAKKICVTVRNFISHRGFYAVHVKTKSPACAKQTVEPAESSAAQDARKELNDLTHEQFEELLVLVRKLKAGETGAPEDEEEVEDEIDRLQKEEEHRNLEQQLAHSMATIAALKAELAALREAFARSREKI